MTLDEITKNLPALFAAVFTAILFIQSGMDKVLDWKGNVEWLTGHFAKSPLAGMVPAMLATITLMELTTGLVAAAGIVSFFLTASLKVIFYSGVLGAASITALFFGQRIAKDYAGAAVLVPYFIVMIVMMILTNPFVKT